MRNTNLTWQLTQLLRKCSALVGKSLRTSKEHRVHTFSCLGNQTSIYQVQKLILDTAEFKLVDYIDRKVVLSSAASDHRLPGP